MDRFWEQVNKSNVGTIGLALLVWGAIVYLAIAGRPIPEVLSGGGMSVIAFFFGVKLGQRDERSRLERLIVDLQGKVDRYGL